MPTLTLTYTAGMVLPMAKLCRDLTVCLGRRGVKPKHVLILAMPATVFYGPVSVERPMVRMTIECSADRERAWRDDVLSEVGSLLVRRLPNVDVFVALVPVNPADNLTPAVISEKTYAAKDY